MDSKLIIGAAAVAVAGIWLFRKKNQEKVQVRNANKASEDLSDPATNAAVKIKQALNLRKLPAIGWTGTTVSSSNGSTGARANLFNACLEVTSWKNVQSKFSQLCDNEVTLLDALQRNTDTETFNTAKQLLQADKVVTKTACNALLTLYDEKNKAIGDGVTHEFPANTILGAFVSSYNGNTSFINGFQWDGDFFFADLYSTKGYTATNKINIINPNK